MKTIATLLCLTICLLFGTVKASDLPLVGKPWIQEIFSYSKSAYNQEILLLAQSQENALLMENEKYGHGILMPIKEGKIGTYMQARYLSSHSQPDGLTIVFILPFPPEKLATLDDPVPRATQSFQEVLKPEFTVEGSLKIMDLFLETIHNLRKKLKKYLNSQKMLLNFLMKT